MSSFDFPVEAGHIMMFARSIGDPNPVYWDPVYAATTEVGHVIAPPTFVQASAQYDPDFMFRPEIGKPWLGSGKAPTGITLTAVDDEAGDELHAEQHYEYHRIFGPGEVLTVTTRDGESWQRLGRRGGTLVFTEYFTDYRDESGALVVSVKTVGVRTSKKVKVG
ncbi:MAG: MaoC family dehydratase N-terminal domain-containing protein [Acidimicrobiales bacterium]|jgi:hypothetical protein